MPTAFVHPSGDLLVIEDFISSEEEAHLIDTLYGGTSNHKWVTLSRRRLLNLGGLPGGTTSSGEGAAMIPEPIPSWAMSTIGPRLLEVNKQLSNLDKDTTDEVIQEGDPVSQIVAAIRAGSSSTPIRAVCAQPINHILVNEYVAPHGILGHEDGPAYEPIVSIVSLESCVRLAFAPKGDGGGSSAPVEVCLPPRSLVVFTGVFYTEYLHSIAEEPVDTFTESGCLNYTSALKQPGAAVAPTGGSVDVPRGPRRVSLTYRKVKRVAAISRAAIFGGRRR